MGISKKVAFRDILKDLREENLAVFAGAGMSVDCGYVNWAELLRPIADELGLKIEKENDLVTLAQYHRNEFSSRSKINQVLIEEFASESTATENHRILSRLPIGTFWTTNYDKLIEKALEAEGKIPDVKYTVNQLATTKPKRDAIVFKMHGDAEHPDKAILTKDDYESYHINMQPFLSALAGDLVSKTFLFIGFSFSDPNLDYILSRVRTTYNDQQRRHYCFLRNVKQQENEEQVDFEYRMKKQEYFVRDLKRFSIETILIDEYLEITEFLSNLEKAIKRDCMFISGAAHEYGSWGKSKSEEFIHDLSKNIIRNGFRIVSGFGLGVGSAVISGALEVIYQDLKNNSKDALILRPFPQTDSEKELWSKYRQDMIAYAGLAIFLFGNKREDGELIESSGMREEFEIAQEKKMLLLPVGSTGYISKKFHEEILADFDDFYPGADEKFKELFIEIGDESKSPEEITKTVIEILKRLVE